MRAAATCVQGHDLVDVTPADAAPNVTVYGCTRCGYGMPDAPALEPRPIDVRPLGLIALAGGLVMMLGLLLALLVSRPLNGMHLLAAILVVAGGLLVVWAIDAATPDDDR